MKTSIFFFVLIVLLCNEAMAQKQGIRGQVQWVSGNQMPGPGMKPPAPLGVQREIYIYELTSIKDTNQEEGFFTSVRTKLITKVLSKRDGSFKIKLPPGHYSIFVKEPKGLFASQFDKEGNINPVIIQQKRFSPITISINYQAAY